MSISIHALREESDLDTAMFTHFRFTFQSTLSVRRATSTDWLLSTKGGISIHALREESDMQAKGGDKICIRFQSTLSVRRATAVWVLRAFGRFYFNPRSP